MFNSLLSRGTLFMEQGNRYRALTISCPAEQLHNLVPFFPFFKKIISPAGPDKPKILFRHHHWINSPIIEIINHLLSGLHRGNPRRHYFNLMIKELLFSLLSLEYAETITGKKPDCAKAEAIGEAKYILETSYGKSVTLRKIARQVDMDVRELENELNQWPELNSRIDR